jgi:hypothetical protein
MKKLRLDDLKVDSFATTAPDGSAGGTVAAHEAPTLRDCPYSFGGTCVITGCLPCYTDDPCG